MSLKIKIILMLFAVAVTGGCVGREVKDPPVLPAEVIDAPQTVTDKNYRPMTMVERYVQKASLLVNSGKIQEAVDALDMALLLDPTNKDAQALLERLRPGREKKVSEPEQVKAEPAQKKEEPVAEIKKEVSEEGKEKIMDKVEETLEEVRDKVTEEKK